VTDPAPESAAGNRIVSVLVGAFLILVFFGLSMTAPGLRITFRAPLSASSPGEVYFWLGHSLLLFPASCLIGFGLAGLLGPLLVRLREEVNRLGARELRLGTLALFLLTVAVSRVGRFLVMYDFPFTDDEYATQFGGYVFATGHAAARQLLPVNAIPSLGLFYHDGMISRADWPGAQVAWAVGDVTGLGPFVWALLAAVPVVALAVLMRRRLDAGWGLAAAVMFLCSPMALMLSVTSHAHLGSRAMLALGLLAYWQATRRGTLALWATTGLAFGLAFLFRPLEIIFFSVPLLGHAAFQSLRRAPGYGPALPGLILGGLVPVLLMCAHAYAVTGNPFVPPRLDDPAAVAQDSITGALWYRFGANVGYNTFMLAIWFLGPLGVALFAAGVMTDRFTRLLGLGTVTGLGLALLHTNMGLHTVGPIHYSELATPLAIIAVHGLVNVLRTARAHRFDLAPISSAVVVSLVVGLGLFNLGGPDAPDAGRPEGRGAGPAVRRDVDASARHGPHRHVGLRVAPGAPGPAGRAAHPARPAGARERAAAADARSAILPAAAVQRAPVRGARPDRRHPADPRDPLRDAGGRLTPPARRGSPYAGSSQEIQTRFERRRGRPDRTRRFRRDRGNRERNADAFSRFRLSTSAKYECPRVRSAAR
jgi:hypothetical protein